MKAKLSMAFQDLRGKDGTVVISKSRTGLILRPRVSPANPKTAAQTGVRGNLSKAAATFKNFSSAQVAAWKAYAQTQTKTNPISGESYSPTAINAFVALASKFLQVSPGGTIPTTPPTSAFAGDTISVTAAAGTGVVTFTASAANASGIKTELLLQKLKGANRTPGAAGYRTQTFTAWPGGAGPSPVSINVAPGTYAAAYRFVKVATGQETGLVTLPMVTVALAVAESTPNKAKKAA